MTIGTVETKNTKLYFLSSDGSPQDILYVTCATGITGLGGAKDQIDITCLDSPEREYKGGFRNPGPVSIPFNFIPTAESHQALMDLSENGETVSWMIVFSDQDGAPTETDGRLISPGPTTAEFLGYVSDFNIDIATNEIVRGTLTVQRSGAVDWNFPTATQP